MLSKLRLREILARSIRQNLYYEDVLATSNGAQFWVFIYPEEMLKFREHLFVKDKRCLFKSREFRGKICDWLMFQVECYTLHIVRAIFYTAQTKRRGSFKNILFVNFCVIPAEKCNEVRKRRQYKT